MNYSRYLRYWLIAILSGFALVATADGNLKSLEIESRGDHTRVVLAFSGHPKYKSFSLVGPNRYVIDVDGIQLAPGADLQGAGGIINGIRTAVHSDNTLRIVLDLNGRPQVAHGLRANANRNASELIIELKGKPQSVPFKKVSWEPKKATEQKATISRRGNVSTNNWPQCKRRRLARYQTRDRINPVKPSDHGPVNAPVSAGFREARMN